MRIIEFIKIKNEGADFYMTIAKMRELLTKDEKITVEYKACQNGIHDDVYETVCSFSNRC